MGHINLNLKTPPEGEPISVDLMRVHLHMDATDEDAYLDEIVIPSARQSVEEALGQGLITQTWEWYWDGGWPGTGRLVFPMGPVLSVNSVKYLDVDGAEQTFDSNNYTVAVKSDRQRLWLNESVTWPDVDTQRPEVAWVDFQVGYGPDKDDVPAKIRHLILLMGEHIYTHRGPVLTGTSAIEIPKTLDYLIEQCRTRDYAPTATTPW